MYIYVYIYVCVCVCICVLTVNGGVDVLRLASFASIWYRNTIIFDIRKTLYLKDSPLENISVGQW